MLTPSNAEIYQNDISSLLSTGTAYVEGGLKEGPHKRIETILEDMAAKSAWDNCLVTTLTAACNFHYLGAHFSAANWRPRNSCISSRNFPGPEYMQLQEDRSQWQNQGVSFSRKPTALGQRFHVHERPVTEAIEDNTVDSAGK